MQIPTVKIKHERRGFVIINESDFDKEKHTLYVEESKAEEKPKATRKPRAKKAEEKPESEE